MISHPAHHKYATRTLSAFDSGQATSEELATALRVFLYEPTDGYQGDMPVADWFASQDWS